MFLKKMCNIQTTENTRVINNYIYLFSIILKCNNSNKSSKNKFVMSKLQIHTKLIFATVSIPAGIHSQDVSVTSWILKIFNPK